MLDLDDQFLRMDNPKIIQFKELRRPRKSFRHLKFAFVSTGLTCAVLAIALARSPTPKYVPLPKPRPQEAVVLPKSDSDFLPKTVPVMKIVPPAPPPVIREPEPERVEPPWESENSSPRRSRPRVRSRSAENEGSNICTRHNLRKVYTNGGRSWRCRR
jgi:hypothetical protein